MAIAHSNTRSNQDPRKKSVPEEIALAAIKQIKSLDQLIEVHSEAKDVNSVPTHVLVDVISKELASQELFDFLRQSSIRPAEQVNLKEIASVLKKLPRKLYFFLWSMQNSDVIPIQGVMNSSELRDAIFALIKFLRTLEQFSKKCPNSIPLHEHLGYVYFDLAGLAQYSPKGLHIAGNGYDHAKLLRKAIQHFQRAIQLDAENARELDTSHLDVLGLLDQDIELKRERLRGYLNPWHFLYISSALKLLNDKKIASVYLVRARSIINILDEHQNQKLRKQKDFLESVYSSIHYGEHLKFDFGQKSLMKIQKKLNRIQRNKRNRNGYSPMAEDALAHQLDLQRLFMTEGQLQAEHKAYLRGIYQLYNEPVSPLERDKVIYRLNIPPVKLTGLRDRPGAMRLKGTVAEIKNGTRVRQLAVN